MCLGDHNPFVLSRGVTTLLLGESADGEGTAHICVDRRQGSSRSACGRIRDRCRVALSSLEARGRQVNNSERNIEARSDSG